MRVESSYPSITMGVSTLSKENRSYGQAESQVNFRNDPLRKMRRRPPLMWDAELVSSEDTVDVDSCIHHMYIRDDVKYEFILDKSDGTLLCYIDGVLTETLSVTASYIGDNMLMRTVGHETFVINRDKKVTRGSSTDYDDGTAKRVSYINFSTAPEYEDELGFTIYWPNNGGNGTYVQQISILIYNEDETTGVVGRSVDDIAEYLATTLDLSALGLTIDHEGSVVSFYTDNVSSSGTSEVTLEERTDYDTDSFILTNVKNDSANYLPGNAIPGSVVIIDDDSSDSDQYYLKAVADDGSSTGMTEVTWVETRSPSEAYNLNSATLPVRCVYSGGDFTLVTDGWRDRQAGDDESNPVPDFVGRTIGNIGYMQGRLMFLAEDYVLLSETNDIVNFWLQSAVASYDTDPISITSSEIDTDNFMEVQSHDRDVLLITPNSQFKIDGDTAITPSNASMTKTTSFDADTSTRPVALGNAVVFPTSSGELLDFQKYFIDSTTDNDYGKKITAHVRGYLVGSAELLASSSNYEVLVAKLTSANNELFVFEQYSKSDTDVVQEAWSKWVLPEEDTVLNLHIKDGVVYVVCKQDSTIHSKSMMLDTLFNTAQDEVYLDNMLVLTTDGTTATLPDGYDITDCVVVRGEGTTKELFQVDYEVDDRDITLATDVGAGELYVGKLFTSEYEPTRPYMYDDRGLAITTDVVRMSKFIAGVINTYELKLEVSSDYYDTTEQEFKARAVNGVDNLVGVKTPYTGDVQFSFKHNPDQASAKFVVDGYLACTIAKLTWAGKYNRAGRRI